jgi:hypothetical protein
VLITHEGTVWLTLVRPLSKGDGRDRRG